jgi:vancomycin resistance protein VanJ
MLARLRRWFGNIVVASAFAYPALLLAGICLLWFVGERWWVTGFALYLPRLPLAIPLPLLAVLLYVQRRFRLLALQGVSLALLLFPLLGLSLGWSHSVAASVPKLRVMQFNVDSCNSGADKLAAEITKYQPDIALLQELPPWRREPLQSLLAARYPHIAFSGESMLVSKFPIASSEDAPDVEYAGQHVAARAAKYVIETSLGRLALFSLHPISPRTDFHHTRGAGLSREIMSGRLFEHAVQDDMQRTNRLRRLQVQTAARWAAAETLPHLVMGDLNLPHLSVTRHELFSSYQDGFMRAGFGFGYTFPVRFPWMRLDVVLASPQLEFSDFEVCDGRVSDHHCVVAELIRAAR